MIGLASIQTSLIFFITIGKGVLWLSIFCGVFGIGVLGFGIAFLVIFVSKHGSGQLVLTDSFITIPGRWKKRRTLNLNDVTQLSEFNSYDHAIELVTEEEVYLIERKWMNPKDFKTVRMYLAELERKWKK